MDAIEQQSMPFPEAQKRPRRLRRGIFLLPSLFTVANLLCGYYACIASLVGRNEDFDHAAKAIGIAILFDSLDGRSRMTGTNTDFGVQFDSLADVVSFGIAPAVLAYAWGFRSGFASIEGHHQLGEVAWIACLTFLICSASAPRAVQCQRVWNLVATRILLACQRLRRLASWRQSFTPAIGSVPSHRSNGRLLGSFSSSAGWAHDQHCSLLQFQRYSVEQAAAFHHHCGHLPFGCRNLAIFRVRSGHTRNHVCRGRYRPPHSPFRAAASYRCPGRLTHVLRSPQ